jgi:hypothetical protein
MCAYILPRCFTGKHTTSSFSKHRIFNSINKNHIMTHYTGMGPGTIQYYHHVVAEMHANMPSLGRPNLQPVHGQVFQAQPSFASAHGTHHIHSGAQPMGYNSMVNNQVGVAGRALIRDLFH